MNLSHSIPAILIAVVMIVSCKPERKTFELADPLASHIDSTVNPAVDFFDFANGKWFKEHPIPSSEQSNGIFQTIDDTVNAQVLKICQSAALQGGAPKGSNKQKIGDLYFSGMDSMTINKNGINDLSDLLGQIDKIKTKGDLAGMAAKLHRLGSSVMFTFYIGQDDKISSKMAVFIHQGGLSMPDRSYYIDNDSKSGEIRKKFLDHLQNIFRITGYDNDNSLKSAGQVMKLETALAKSSRKREDTRDPWKNYNKITTGNLEQLAPDFIWDEFFNTGLKKVDTVIVGQPEFLQALNSYIISYPLDTWKNYFKYRLISTMAPYLDDSTYAEYFNFYGRALRGIEKPRPRWKRVVNETDGDLGDLIGQVYVSEYLPKGSKEKLEEIGLAIKNEYAARIKILDWMTDSTKQKALDKLNAVIMKLGFPDKWKDMSALNIDRSSYVNNVMASNRWYFDYMISKFGKPVDRTEWDMEPQTYNAYYNPSNNEIVIPGCNILIPGYEHTLPDDALLYSIIGGSTFGHELTHGFDDQGSKYDQNGNLHNWWSPEDSIKFYSKTKLIVSQFSEYIAVDNLHINGENTQGENIADLGGIMMGYEAFKKTDQYKDHQVIGGLTPDQRFFLGYALAWMVNQRPEAMAMQVKSNEHSPAKFRVIGPLSNMPEFYKTFNIKPGDAMWRPDSLRVKIW